ncbi:MAG: OAM dimerization domain-containing protein [Candidatus Calescibacterium sp.]|nr:cobalamin-dependent protein [Candidatus Calescibacterium sp.]MCX7972182.1 cobalamin-dependent protein [bacterium]MDW8194872.1 OAM dimerization domain-containing protein [Candidatus Calescibacterium sp.]
MDIEKLRFVKPYGDTFNDGIVQLSFTLPAKDRYTAIEAAKVLVSKMGIRDAKVATVEEPLERFFFFVIYGSVVHEIDMEQIRPIVPEYVKMSKEEVEEYAAKNGIEKIVIVGATIGTDSHTVGLDSILNIKGFKGEKGLEAYKCFKVYNLGPQVMPSELVKKVKELKAQAILVSQTITQKNMHLKNLTELVDLLEAEELRERVILICGGSRIDHKIAKELGYDAGFGPNTTPSDVASFIVQFYVKKGVRDK